MGLSREGLVRLIRLRRGHLGRRPRPRKRLPRQVAPVAVEVFYGSELLGLRAIAVAMLRQHLFPQLTNLLAEAARDRGDSNTESIVFVTPSGLHQDAAARRGRDIIEGIRKEMAARIPDETARRLAEQVAERTKRHGREQLDRQLKAGLGLDVLHGEPNVAQHLSNFVEQNVALIKSVPDELLYRVEQGLMLGLRQSWRSEELAKHLEDQMDVSESKARFIARDQVSKLNGELNELRQKALGLSEYVWRTVLDEAVRPSHAEKEGERFAWDDPPADTGHPGEDFQCRCSAEPFLDDMLEQLEEG